MQLKMNAQFVLVTRQTTCPLSIMLGFSVMLHFSVWSTMYVGGIDLHVEGIATYSNENCQTCSDSRVSVSNIGL